MSYGVVSAGLGLLAFALTFFFVRWLLATPASGWLILDQPNRRSLHRVPVPTGGGLAVVSVVLLLGAGVSWWQPAPGLIWLGAGGGLVAVVSFVDDHHSLSPALRLGMHLAAAGVLLLAGFVPEALMLPGVILTWPWWAAAGFTWLYIVWMTNLYNFMDGMDGFAAGMCVIGFTTFALLGWQAGDPGFTAVSAIIASASGGFLVFNFPPARVFLGDVGSSSLGFLAAALTLWADREDIFPLWIGVVVFSPFVVDATSTLFRRLLRGEQLWEAHRTHFYQRVVQSGWSHRRTVLWEYLLMLLAGVAAMIALPMRPSAQWLLLCVLGVAYTILILMVYRLEALHRSSLDA